ncbi:MAG: hypothetical protein KF873_14510 [Gemmataceae bacterium]|nr:hypothetical protein [Gemmataceae bacterium]
MPRWIAVGMLLALPSLLIAAELPIVAPQPIDEVPATPQPAVPVPSHPPVASAWAVSCQPASACTDPCAAVRVKKPGVLSGLKNWLCGTTPNVACDATCPTPMVRVVIHEPCPAPAVNPVAMPCPAPEACPAPVACPTSVVCPTPTSYAKPIISKLLPTRPTVECPKVDAMPTKRFACVGTACDKVKALLCWKPCNEQILPILCPAPYHAPATAYLGPNREPVPGLSCGTCRKLGKTKCDTGACPSGETSVAGPVAGAKPHPVMGGWTPIYANYPPAPSTVVPAKAVEPAMNPIARPFTSP